MSYDLQRNVGEAYSEAYGDRFDRYTIPFKDAVPIEAVLRVVTDARTKGWSADRIEHLESSWVFKFTPPDWTPEKQALLDHIEGKK